MGDTLAPYSGNEIEPEIEPGETTAGVSMMEEFPDMEEISELIKPNIKEDRDEHLIPKGDISSSMEFSVFPNPMEGTFIARISGTARGASVSLMVFDAKGQVLRQESHEGGGDLYLEVDLTDQAAGVYFVKVIHGGQMVEERVVKM
jgi:hypothetical protein